jgi:hypothetical protein
MMNRVAQLLQLLCYKLDIKIFRVRFSAVADGSSLHLPEQIWGLPSLSSSKWWGWSSRSVTLSIHLHLMPKIRIWSYIYPWRPMLRGGCNSNHSQFSISKLMADTSLLVWGNLCIQLACDRVELWRGKEFMRITRGACFPSNFSVYSSKSENVTP